MTNEPTNPYRVLALDGGGMRGLYTAVLLHTLAKRFACSRNVATLDIGKGFNLITGTSTGGILACGLANGVPVEQMITLYRESGPRIFIDPMPSKGRSLFRWGWRNACKASCDVETLKHAMEKFFGDRTLEQVFKSRKVALCIPTVNMGNQKSWVFKTPHIANKRRDEKYRLVDICLATSAAPMLFPIARIPDPDDSAHARNFVDGGLWANNPVLVGLIEALETAGAEQPIEILSIGTCAPPEGEPVQKDATSWGIFKWRFGSRALSVALDAQSAGYKFMAEFLAKHLNRRCTVIRLQQSPPSPAQVDHLALDLATEEALDVLSELGKTDADLAYSMTEKAEHPQGKCLRGMFCDMPTMA